MSHDHMPDEAHPHGHGAPHRARLLVRVTVLALAGVGALTLLGLIRSAREPYGGYVEG